MSLEKSLVGVDVGGGVDTRSSEFKLDAGKFLKLENIIYDKELKKYRKRNGFTGLSNYDLSGNKIDNWRSLGSLKKEILGFTSNNMYAFSESNEKWADKGSITNCKVEVESVIRNDYQQSNAAHAIANNQICYAWEDTRGGVYYSIKDLTTGTFFVSDTLINSSGVRAKVLSLGGIFFIVYAVSGTIRYKTVNSGSPTSLSSETTIQSDLTSGTKYYDAVVSDDKIHIAYHSTAGGGDIQIFTLNAAGTASSVTRLTSEVPSNCLSLNVDSSNRILLSYANTTDVKVKIYSYAFTSVVLSTTTIETIADIRNVTMSEDPSTSGRYYVFYESSAASTYNYFIKKNTVTTGAAVGTASILLRSVGLFSKSWKFEESVYFLVVHDSTLQDSYFMVDHNGKIHGKIACSLGGGVAAQSLLQSPSILDTYEYHLVCQYKGKLDSEDDNLFSLLGISEVTVTFLTNKKLMSAEIGDLSYFGSGILWAYDGSVLVEDGFHLYPENIAAGSTATTGGNLSDGTRNYVVVYSWIDNRGQRHRSGVSLPLSVTLSGGGSTQTQNITIPTLRLTQKSNVILEVYRTENAGSIYYKVSSTSSPTFNDKTVNTVTFLDTISDTALIDNEFLYTTGGILENSVTSSINSLREVRGRVLYVSEEGNRVFYSKNKVKGVPIEFNDTFYFDVEEGFGGVSAVAELDDKIVFFKKYDIFAIRGDGPLDTGLQNDFAKPEAMAFDVGAIDQRSIVEMPLGVMFKSEKGIYLLNKGLTLNYVGSDVQDFNDLTVSSACLVADKNEVRFTTSDGDCLVYNYHLGQWATSTNFKAYDSLYLDNVFYFVNKSADQIYKEDSTFGDFGSGIRMVIETGWLSLDVLQSYVRLYKLLILGDFKSAHTLKIKVAYDYEPYWSQEVDVVSSNIVESGTYGSGATYGSDSYYGGSTSTSTYQIRVDAKKQKCQSFRLRIEDAQSSTIGEGWALGGLTLEVGQKRGAFKPKQAKIAGLA